MTIPTKRCTKCGEEKPLTEFHRNRAKAGGRLNECRDCRAEVARVYRREVLGQRPRKTYPTLQDRRWMEQKLLKEFRSLDEIAEEVGCSPRTVSSHAKELGISVPPAPVREIFRARIDALEEREWA